MPALQEAAEKELVANNLFVPWSYFRLFASSKKTPNKQQNQTSKIPQPSSMCKYPFAKTGYCAALSSWELPWC